MPKETKELEKKDEKNEEQKEFLTKVAELKYPFADVFGIVKVVPRNDEENLSLGFADSNGRKEICLTATKELWKKTAQDLLDYLNGK